MRTRTIEWLERHTSETRSRHAADIFLRGRPRRRDRAVAWAYFAVSAPRWAGYEQAASHLGAFAEGLEHCHRPEAALDIGTGTGGAAAMVASRYPDASVVAVDTSRAMLRRARSLHADSSVTFRRASALHLPFPNRSFDLVTCVNAVPEPNELTRVSRPGAEILLATTTRPLRDEGSAWVRRWRETGFARTGAGEVGGGSWELYQRVAA